jgi:hypothetical protein
MNNSGTSEKYRFTGERGRQPLRVVCEDPPFKVNFGKGTVQYDDGLNVIILKKTSLGKTDVFEVNTAGFALFIIGLPPGSTNDEYVAEVKERIQAAAEFRNRTVDFKEG